MKIIRISKIFLSILVIISFNSCSNIDISVKCSYMGYACGDCYPQFRIDSIISIKKSNYSNLIGKDVYIIYNEQELEELIDSCWICYDYYVEGNLQKSLFKKYFIIRASSYYLKDKRPDCCE